MSMGRFMLPKFCGDDAIIAMNNDATYFLREYNLTTFLMPRTVFVFRRTV